ncbi:MAG: hypothetical protein CMN76_03915 [Spirochaetaceae bacterium]|mgnify:CR=1 FL=1|nr:hypothetical protein [Spirochaetaceae bacterium]|tara:strand:- start:247906 stop:248571 length:666 start_codon:yes stop_codon:yes gene_type:complete
MATSSKKRSARTLSANGRKKTSAPKKAASNAGKKAARAAGPGTAAQKSALSIIESGHATGQQALEVFDSLPVVELDFMWGKWKGSGIDTDHPMDGLLENYAWYGKQFIDENNVHPLIFETGSGKHFIVNPALMPMGLALTQQWLKKPFMRGLFRTFRFLLSTKKTKARLRMTELRGKVTATMCYDALPIHDVFRKVDENIVMGYMDFKHMDTPFFFALRRV